MRLRTYLSGFSALILGAVIGLLIYRSTKVIKENLEEVHQEQRNHVSALVGAGIESAKTDLKGLANTLRTNNDLASAYILAMESRDTEVVERKLKKIQTDADVSLLDILDLRGNAFRDASFSVSFTRAQEILSGREYFEILDYRRMLLVYYCPLNLYDNAVGILTIGISLPDRVAAPVEKMTSSQVNFLNQSCAPAAPGEYQWRVEGSDRCVNARIEIQDNAAVSIQRNLSWQMTLIAVLALVILLLFLYFLVEVGFVRGFMSLVQEVDTYTQEIANGVVRPFTFRSFQIRENKLLSLSIGRLANTIQRYKEELQQKSQLEAEMRQQAALTTLASQVAHDIRSPLTALTVMTQDLSALPESQRVLLRSAITRIQDIANSLLEKRRNPAAPTAKVSAHLVSTIVEEAVSEKRLRFKNENTLSISLQCPNDCYDTFALLEPTQFSRLVSNILENAIEAFPEGRGNITVAIGKTNSEVFVTITDNGRGIPPEILPRLGTLGESHGKAGGSGLGLHHAHTCLQEWGGTLSIQSQPGKGTTVKISLIPSQAPLWFLSRLDVSPYKKVVILDDDNSIHQVWASKIKKIPLVHFTSAVEAEKWLTQQDNAQLFFLVDYELLGQDVTGLDFVLSHGLRDRAVLVTSRYENQGVLKRCLALNIQMIPKPLVDRLPVAE